MDTSSNEYIALMMADPEIANNPRLRSLLNTNASKIKWNTNTAQDYANPLFKGYQDTNEEIKRIYGEQLGAGQKGVASETDYAQKDYQTTIDQLNQGLMDSTSELSNSSASKGSFGSTAYEERKKSLTNQYNNKFGSAYDTASRNADVSGMRNQTQLGYNTTNPTFQKFNTQGSTGQSYRYNPFQQAVGGLEAEKNYTLRTI